MRCWHRCGYVHGAVLSSRIGVRQCNCSSHAAYPCALCTQCSGTPLSSQTPRRLTRDARAAAQTTHQTAHGQLLDIATAPIGTVDLSRYTLPTYMRIVTFKTAFYSFYLPVACGLLVGGVAAPPALALARDVCVQMGQYFQARAAPGGLCPTLVGCAAQAGDGARTAGCACGCWMLGSLQVQRLRGTLARSPGLTAGRRQHARRSRTTTWTASATRR